MASSRWKRFAFFDRNNLSLPPAVLEDILPPQSPAVMASTTSSSTTATANSSSTGTTSPTTNTMTTASSSNTPPSTAAASLDDDLDVMRVTRGEYVSLCLSCAALPEGVSMSHAAANANVNVNANHNHPHSQSQSHTRMGVSGMMTSLSACARAWREQEEQVGRKHPTTLSITQDNTSMASDPNTLIHDNTHQLTTTVTNTTTSTSSSASCLCNKNGYVSGCPPLVLAFLSSRSSRKGRVHVIDLTVRCNPLNGISPHNSTTTTTTNNHNNNNNNSTNLTSKKDSSNALTTATWNTNNHNHKSTTNHASSNNKHHSSSSYPSLKHLEDLDGWRGYFRPFLYGKIVPNHNNNSTTSTTTSTTTSNTNTSNNTNTLSEDASSSLSPTSSITTIPTINTNTINNNNTNNNTSSSNHYTTRIVGMAICSATQDPSLRYKKTGKDIYTACITDEADTVGIVVHRNPHLYLQFQMDPPTNTHTHHYSQHPPNSNHNHNHNLTILPKTEIHQPMSKFDFKHRGKPRCVDISFVMAGSGGGLVAVGTDNGTVLLYSFQTGGSAGSNSKGGINNTQKLSFVMEIPPPRYDHDNNSSHNKDDRKGNTISSNSSSNSNANSNANANTGAYTRRNPSSSHSTSLPNRSTNASSSTSTSTSNTLRYAVSAVKLAMHSTDDEQLQGQQQRQEHSFSLSKKVSLSNSSNKQQQQHKYRMKIYVTYRLKHKSTNSTTHPQETQGSSNTTTTTTTTSTKPKFKMSSQSNTRRNTSSSASSSHITGGGGVYCYDLGPLRSSGFASSTHSKPIARYDLDGRDVASSCLCDITISSKTLANSNSITTSGSNTNVAGTNSSTDNNIGHPHTANSSSSAISIQKNLMVARSDGLYTYSTTDKIGIAPIDGTKIAMCSIPPPMGARRNLHSDYASSSGPFFGDANSISQSTLSSKISGTSNTNNAHVSTTITTTTTTTTTTLVPTNTATRTNSTNQPSSNPSSSSFLSSSPYVLVATTDSKSGRDAVDVYDPSNKLVAFHVLLSPGHRALRAASIATKPVHLDSNHLNTNNSTSSFSDTSNYFYYGGLSSAVVLTSGGAVVTLTERRTSEKVSLLVQKNLYSAAISIAYADASYRPDHVMELYRAYAEHLYRKSDFSSSMEQYIHTIGSLEPSYVIFRFLDAPKLHLLTHYLEQLRRRSFSTPLHDNLLRTCHLKLNDVEAAERVRISSSFNPKMASLLSPRSKLPSSSSLYTESEMNQLLQHNNMLPNPNDIANLLHDPHEALATLCSLDAPHAVEALIQHGVTLVRPLPREVAGLVVSLTDGTYSPDHLAEMVGGNNTTADHNNGTNGNADNSSSRRRHLTTSLGKSASHQLENAIHSSKSRSQTCELYPLNLFGHIFLEHPKLFRILLSHAYAQKRHLGPIFTRTLLELTLEEWNIAKRTHDVEKKKSRRTEAMTILTDPHCIMTDDTLPHENSNALGREEALVIVNLAGFDEGEVLMYEQLHDAPALVGRYAKEGSEKSRRQMLALCRTDPKLLADVLGHFVDMTNRSMDKTKVKVVSNSKRSLIGKGFVGDIHGKVRGEWNKAKSSFDSNDFENNDDDYGEEILPNSNIDDMLDDIKDALSMAYTQGVLPPVRVARILAGEGIGEFSNEQSRHNAMQQSHAQSYARSRKHHQTKSTCQTVPLSVALDYIGPILDESSRDILNLQKDVEDYRALCHSMEIKIESLLGDSPCDALNKNSLTTSASTPDTSLQSEEIPNQQQHYNYIKQRLSYCTDLTTADLEKMYEQVLTSCEEVSSFGEGLTETSSEEFWREIEQTENRFEAVSRFYGRGIME